MGQLLRRRSILQAEPAHEEAQGAREAAGGRVCQGAAGEPEPEPEPQRLALNEGRTRPRGVERPRRARRSPPGPLCFASLARSAGGGPTWTSPASTS